MPYIPQKDRGRFQNSIVYLGLEILNPGEFNYVISKLMEEYIHRQGKCYDTLNELIGVLECAKMELYRRIAAPYEDMKCKQNGDVYE